MKRHDSGLVYSTGRGRMCPVCENPLDKCCCKTKPAKSVGDGVVRVRREVAGRKGKAVTTVSGVPLEGAALLELAKGLKRLCGSGGTLKDGVIEVQGDHVDKVMARLQQDGYTVKRSGG
jgi:translation initiation factor 1